MNLKLKMINEDFLEQNKYIKLEKTVLEKEKEKL